MKREGSARFAKIRDHVPFAAKVYLAIDEDAEPALSFELEGTGFTSQGTIETVPTRGYDAWREAAREGVRYGLRTIRKRGAVTIRKIVGAVTDTTPGAVAAASALAVFDAFGVAPSDHVREAIESAGVSEEAHFPETVFAPPTSPPAVEKELLEVKL